MKFILGKKIEMSQMFNEKGDITPVTLIEAGPCVVLQKKSKEKDGYDAIQIGFIKIEKKTRIKKPMKGKEYKYIKEARQKGLDARDAGSAGSPVFGANVGEEVNVSIFKEGDKVNVVATSKGKGFQGGVKRHGFHGRDATHGMKHEARTIGSIGQRFPQHTIKGRRMPGRMGFDRTTVKNLTIAKIDVENNVLAIRGAIPAHRVTLVEIRG